MEVRVMGYIEDGTFRKKLEAFFGPLAPQDPVEEREDWVDDAMSVLPEELQSEVNALYELHRQFVVPELCSWGAFDGCTWPMLYDLDEEELRDEGFFDDEADVERALTNVALYNNQWGTYVTVGAEGVLHLFEDPHSFHPLCADLGTFLDVAMHLQAAKEGKFPVDDAAAMAEHALHRHDDDYPLFIQSTLDAARGES